MRIKKEFAENTFYHFQSSTTHTQSGRTARDKSLTHFSSHGLLLCATPCCNNSSTRLCRAIIWRHIYISFHVCENSHLL